ncbi:MAG: serpin family protein [Armatimonadota bacterium]|nr:serpin family protein [Armatimonadota bacterium]
MKFSIAHRRTAALFSIPAAISLIGCRSIAAQGAAPAPVQPTTPATSSGILIPSRKLPAVDPARAVSAGEQKLVAANTGFGFRLFTQLLAKTPGQNVFFSPMSVSEAMDLTYNGAYGTTQTAMAKTLGLDSLTLEAANTASANLLGRLQDPDPSVQLNIANSLWTNKRYPLSQSFLQRDQQFFGAAVGAVDFSSPASANIINAWVNQQTNGKIPTVLSPNDVTAATRIVLANAVYFKGPWTNPFAVDATQKGPFTLADGTKKQVPLMERLGGYSYFETPTFQAISLPYGHQRVRMLVFLPKGANKLDSFLKSLTPQNLQTWSASLNPQQVDLKLPRFKVTYSADLKPPLSELGMGAAFDAHAADFSEMGLRHLFISFVKHVALMSVDEHGTEAAAATVVHMAHSSAVISHPLPPKIMTVNHPFFCAIQDSETGSILFMGSVVNPM